jgi:hypothetical protein
MHTVETFLEAVRARPRVAAAVRDDAEVAAHLEAVEAGIRHVAFLACDDQKYLDVLDEINAVVRRDDLSLKARMLAISEVFASLHAERQRMRGH